MCDLTDDAISPKISPTAQGEPTDVFFQEEVSFRSTKSSPKPPCARGSPAVGLPRDGVPANPSPTKIEVSCHNAVNSDPESPSTAVAPFRNERKRSKLTNKPVRQWVIAPLDTMVLSAISNLRNGSGSSLRSIKRYIYSNYAVDMGRVTPAICNYLRTAVADGILTQERRMYRGYDRSEPQRLLPLGEMVMRSIMSLKEGHGCTLKSIKRYMAANFGIDIQKVAPAVSRYLRCAVQDGILMRGGRTFRMFQEEDLTTPKTNVSKKHTVRSASGKSRRNPKKQKAVKKIAIKKKKVRPAKRKVQVRMETAKRRQAKKKSSRLSQSKRRTIRWKKH